MAEHDPAAPQPIEDYLLVTQQFRRLSKRMERWRRDFYLRLRPPEKTLELEKAKLDTKIKRAMADARSCAQSPKLLGRHERALERLIDYADRRRALEPECGCKDRERREDYECQLKECAQNFPIQNAFIPEDVLAELSPSPALSPYATYSERGSTAPLSDDAADSYRDDSSSVAVSPRLRASLPPEATVEDSPSASDEAVIRGMATIAGRGQGQSSKRRLTRTPRAPRKRVRLEASNKATSTSLNNHDGTDAEPHHEPESEDNDEPDSDYQDGDESEFDGDGQACSSANSNRDSDKRPHKSKQPQPRAASQKTIEFAEVYCDGKPEHHIAEYKGKWYILRCDKHAMHFGDKPIKGAAKHLSADIHNNQTREYRLAIALLGIEVLGCDAEGQRISNEAFGRELDEGYQPLGNPPAARVRPKPQQRLPAASVRGRSQRGIDEAVLDPVPGGIYMALWAGSDRVGIIVIPRGCFGDPSFAEVGLPGSSLAEDTVLMDDVPECYLSCPVTRSILGWADGYEDGGERVAEREYPVMYFDGVDTLRKKSVAWLSVKDLRVYDREACKKNRALISNYTHLRRFEAQRERAMEGVLSAASQPEQEPAVVAARQQEEEPAEAGVTRQEEEPATVVASRQEEEEEPATAAEASRQNASATGENSQSEDTEPALSEFNVSPPPEHPAETPQSAPETSRSCTVATGSSHQGHTAHVTDEQRSSERNPAVEPWPRHHGPLFHAHLRELAIMRANAARIAAARRNGKPPYSDAVVAPCNPAGGSGEGMTDALRGSASIAMGNGTVTYNSGGGGGATPAGLTASLTGGLGLPRTAREPADKPRIASAAFPAERLGSEAVSARASRERDGASEHTPDVQSASRGHAKTAAQPTPVIPSRGTPPRAEPCRVQLGTTYDAPIDLDGWGQPRTPRRHEPRTTLPGFSSFEQSIEDPPPAIYRPDKQAGGWTVVRDLTVPRGHFDPNPGTPTPSSASRAALVSEATTPPVGGGFNCDTLSTRMG